MIISQPEITPKGNELVYQVHVKYAKGNKILWYRLNEEYGELISNKSDASLVALLVPAMANGEDIHIEGRVSKKLFYNLSRPLQVVLKHVIPSLRMVKIHAEEVVGNLTMPPKGVATGFSGGVDSFSVLADNYYSNAIQKYNITHLLFNSVGSMAKAGERQFRKRYERLLPVTQQIGIPFVMITSNLNDFYGPGINFLQTHTIRDASVALLLQGGIGSFLYASSYSYQDTFIGPANSMSHCDTITLPLLSTEALHSFSVGSEYTRVEKQLQIAEIPDSYNALDVCVNPLYTGDYINCGTCWKCLRTLSILDIAGLLDLYSTLFDLDAYHEIRNEYFAELLSSEMPIQQEIIQFSRQRNFTFPLSAHLIKHAMQAVKATHFPRRVQSKLQYLVRQAI